MANNQLIDEKPNMATFKMGYVMHESLEDLQGGSALERLHRQFEGYNKDDIITSMHYHRLSGIWVLVGTALLAEGVTAL